MIHTSALHVPGECVVCVCGQIFKEGEPNWRVSYTTTFATHLSLMNTETDDG